MWLLAQTGRTALNTDQVVSIYIDTTTKTIKARLNDSEGRVIQLASYNTIEECESVFNELVFRRLERARYDILPLGGQIDDWRKDII